jgi:hypothetical protein
VSRQQRRKTAKQDKKLANDIIRSLWDQALSFKRNGEYVVPMAFIVDYHRFMLPIPRPIDKGESDEARLISRDLWAHQIKGAARDRCADMVITITEAYMSPPGLETESLSVVLAGGRIKDMPNPIDAIILSAETRSGKARMLWVVLEEDKLGKVTDLGWSKSQSQGVLSQWFG